MDIRSNSSQCSPSSLGEPTSDFIDNSVDETRYIQPPDAHSNSSETKALANRSVIETKIITNDELRNLILEQKFSKNVHYQVEGNLFLRGCTGLTALPENLSVGGDLSLYGCTGLTALPENLSVGGDLSLAYCTGLTALPEHLSVGGNLFLTGCTGLTALPEHLSVGGKLSLYGCTGLTALPENLSVGGNLNLGGCTGLTALPEHLSVGGYLDLGDCTGLTALPNWITTLGMTTEGNIRDVNLENTGLSDTLIDRLREVETPDMHFYFSRSAGQPEQQFSNVVEGLTFWRQLTSADSEIPELNLRHDQATDLVRYLGRLTNTADYQNQATRPVLAQRVMAVTALLTGSDGIKDEAMDHIHHALTSCEDRIILALDDLETLQLLDSAEKKAFAGNADELRELGLQMMRLDEVKRIARDHMKTLRWVDEIEVELAFQIGVRQQLALPGSTQHMIFRGCANVSDQDIANAVNQVNTHCSDDNLQAYLAQWDPWQKYLRQQDVPAYDQLTQKTVDRIEDCVISAKITPKMVALGDNHLDYDALVKAVVKNGKNPLTNSPMDWSNVFRLTKEDSPPPL
ncbi:NEL-type E3 ubiquitin ligase domain-containing protein [Endozoicomonas atrinae]|uniref:NEL-type E3 ubiquitin ligase domain-containing protein n=1 Tax=Endozoicomonas atrinae TaxID=1333660 RepID=UPI0008260AE5|nr:NEL-type E3 ubiquitin ligase domain-containing protein [Endozoicomonas atrinae]